ncbi:MAG: citrate synthase [Candidatus Avoscillospira sp.]
MITPYTQEYMQRLKGLMEKPYTLKSRDRDDISIKRGLRNADGTGVLIGVTNIGSVQGYYIEDGERVPMPGKLYYRGISLEDIVESHRKNGTFGFTEVVFLLLVGRLPTESQLKEFETMLAEARSLPSGFVEDMILRAPSQDIMNKLARSVLALYSYDSQPNDLSPENLIRQSIELVARFPTIVANAYATKRHYYDKDSLYIHNSNPELSVAEDFLRMLRKDNSFTEEEAHLLDLMLMIHAEHGGGNNSTYVCRAMSSSHTDTYSAIAGAVGSLKGPLHGGANAKVMEMFRNVQEHVKDHEDEDEISAYLSQILQGKAGDGSGKIYGLGHAVYTMSDPRCELLKKYSMEVARKSGHMDDLALMMRIEKCGIPLIMQAKNLDIPICANVDMYSGLIYSFLNIPPELFTPLFAIARVSGWCAHRMEELLTCNRIHRPAYRASKLRVPYTEMKDRK